MRKVGEVRHSSTTDGLQDIAIVKALAASERKERKKPKKRVGSFGIGVGREEIAMAWVVSPRQDDRHGFVGKTEPMGPYSKHLIETMFKHW